MPSVTQVRSIQSFVYSSTILEAYLEYHSDAWHPSFSRGRQWLYVGLRMWMYEQDGGGTFYSTETEDVRRIYMWIVTDVSKGLTASLFRVKQSKVRAALFNPEDDCTNVFRKSVTVWQSIWCNVSEELQLQEHRLEELTMTSINRYWMHSILTLILRRSRTGTVWFYTSTSNKRAARPKLYTKSLTRDLKSMYSRLTLVRIYINL